MKLTIKVFCVLFCVGLMLLPTQYFYAMTIGSDTSPTRFNTQQTVNNGVRIASFAALAGGFRLANSSVIGFFDSIFPVSGPVDLNQGNLVLLEDLTFRDVTDFRQFGTISGNNYSMSWAPTMTLIPTVATTDYTFTVSNVVIYLNSNVTLQRSGIRCRGNVSIVGQGNSLSLGSTSTIIVDSGASLLLSDIAITGVSDFQIQCLDDVGTITYDNVSLVLDGNYTFTRGKFEVRNNLSVSGAYTFAYQSSQQSTINSKSEIFFDSGVTFSYAPPIASRDLLKMVDSSSQLTLNSATLYSTTTGLRLTKGTIMIDGLSNLSSDATVDAQAISLGDGVSAANNVTIEWLPDAQLVIRRGRVVYANV